MNTKKTSEKPRWIYRFDNYKRAFLLLREAIESMQEKELSQLEKEGIIQRFEYTWELTWKLLKDYLEHEGIVFDKITPASVIRKALEAKIITGGELWMEALDTRNQMSHTYDFKKFETTIKSIDDYYLGILDELYLFMLENSLSQRDV